MSLLELDHLTDVTGGYIEPHPDRLHGLVTNTIEPQSHIEDIYCSSIFSLSDYPSGTEAFVDEARYVVVHGSTNGNSVTSLERTEAIKLLRGGTVIYKNRAYSVINCEDGILRGEDHIFDDVHPQYGPARRYERLNTVRALDTEGKQLFVRVAMALNETLSLPA